MSDRLFDATLDIPPLRGRHTLLRPALQDDLVWLYRIATTGAVGTLWRFHGSLLTIDAFAALVTRDAAALMVIESNESSPSRIGLVQLTQLNLRSHTAHLTAFLDEEHQRKAWPIEALVNFVTYVFAAYNLRKIYAEVLETEMERYQPFVGTMFEEEGRLRDHEFLFGHHLDVHILAITRDQWTKAWAELEVR